MLSLNYILNKLDEYLYDISFIFGFFKGLDPGRTFIVASFSSALLSDMQGL